MTAILGDPGKQLYRSTTIFNPNDKSYECVLFEQKEPILQNITLSFPLYQGVKEVLIGVEKGLEVIAPPPFRSEKRVIFYGTSIMQGGCASRPGMAYTNIASRLLNIECINLGFSGNGRGEPEMIAYFSLMVRGYWEAIPVSVLLMEFILQTWVLSVWRMCLFL